MCDNAVVKSGRLEEGEEAALLLDRTNFYAEQGGQVGDSGVIATPTGRFEVEDAQKLGDAVLHVGRVAEGHIEAGQSATLEVGGDRPHTMRNHTATHLLNWALRKVLGGEINQKGSLVDADKTRFDFTHDKPLSAEEIAEIERLVNEKIYSDLPVRPVTMPLDEAKKIPGVRAVFGEKYPDPVRVLLIGADGRRTRRWKRPSSSAAARTCPYRTSRILQDRKPGGRRQERPPHHRGDGREAVAVVQRQAALLDDLSGRLNCKPDEIAGRVAALQEEVKKLQTQLRKGTAGDLAGAADKLLAAATEANGVKIIVGEMPAGPSEQMDQQLDRLRQKAGSAVVVIGWTEDGKVNLRAAATEDLVKKVRTPASWWAPRRRWSAARAAAARTWPGPAARTRRSWPKRSRPRGSSPSSRSGVTTGGRRGASPAGRQRQHRADGGPTPAEVQPAELKHQLEGRLAHPVAVVDVVPVVPVLDGHVGRGRRLAAAADVDREQPRRRRRGVERLPVGVQPGPGHAALEVFRAGLPRRWPGRRRPWPATAA